MESRGPCDRGEESILSLLASHSFDKRFIEHHKNYLTNPLLSPDMLAQDG
jgi:hypothetical protein